MASQRTVFAALVAVWAVVVGALWCRRLTRAGPARAGATRCAPALATVLSDAVGDNFTARILDLAERAARERPSAVATRNFGLESTGEGGHRVTHLKQTALAQPAFLRELWLLSRRADAWGVTSADARLPLRCMELIEYASAENHSLGFHHDGDTFLTVAVLLSTPGVDFDGGRLELARATRASPDVCTEAHAARALDVVAWRGWEWHRVAPVTRGMRRVLVMEWWAPAHAAEESRTSVERGGDSADGLREALARDPGSSLLRQAVGIMTRAESRRPHKGT